MTVSLAPYRVRAGEKPLASTKQNNMITAVQGAFNAPLAASQIVGYPGDATKYLDGAGHWSIPGLGPTAVPPVSYVKTTTTDVVNTMTATDLFASGSANVNASYTSLIHDIGSALNKVPGRILVIGHTDDQPLRSLRFKDNYELSRARALQVADLIRSEVTDGSRIEVAGKGSLEPRYRPADEPANRARNRRVEIIHLRGG